MVCFQRLLEYGNVMQLSQIGMSTLVDVDQLLYNDQMIASFKLSSLYSVVCKASLRYMSILHKVGSRDICTHHLSSVLDSDGLKPVQGIEGMILVHKLQNVCHTCKQEARAKHQCLECTKEMTTLLLWVYFRNRGMVIFF